MEKKQTEGDGKADVMVLEKSWEEFRKSGLLWWINMILHTFGWSIVVLYDDDNKFERAYPARVKFRGFDEQSNDEGYRKVTEHMAENAELLLKNIMK